MKYRIFKQIVETGSFTKAGETLNMTQSAVSHAIGGLEREMGFKLFHRNKGHVKLTEDGLAILSHVESLVGAEDRLHNQLNAMHNLEIGHLKVGSFASASTRLLPNIMKAFYERYPGVTVEYYDGGYENIKEKLDNGSVDVGFLVDEFLDPDYFVLPYFKDELVAVFSKERAEGIGNSVPIKFVETQPFLMPDDARDTYLSSILLANNVTPVTRATFKLMSTVFSMVEADVGVTIVAESALHKMNHDVSILHLEPKIYRNINLVAKKSQMRSPIVKAFFEIAKNLPSK